MGCDDLDCDELDCDELDCDELDCDELDCDDLDSDDSGAPCVRIVVEAGRCPGFSQWRVAVAVVDEMEQFVG